MVENVLNRRSFIRGVGATSIAAGLAGCSGGGDGSGDGGGDGGGEETTAAPETAESSDGGSGGPPSEVQEYLSDADNFDGSVVDETGSDSVTVTVGAEGNGGNFAFDPPAVRVSSGTEVVWEWTGQGGQHNVVTDDAPTDFESELAAEEGYTFGQTLEESGVYMYNCSPHLSLGMKGAVIVE